MDWNDLRYVLAIARTGSLGAAARQLRVDHSSVYRRLEKLEQVLDTRVFERHRTGYRLTAPGEVLAEAAKRIEAETLAIERQVLGTDLEIAGQVRVSTSEALSIYYLPDVVRDFRAAYPQIELEIAATNQKADLTRRDADLAIRAAVDVPDTLVGRRVCSIGIAGYIARKLVGRARDRLKAEALNWIGFDESTQGLPHARWLREHLPHVQIALRMDSLSAMRSACVAGLGAAMLPCFLGDTPGELVRVPDTHVGDATSLWVLTHPDLRRSARIRACFSFFANRMARDARALGGIE
jgi:molybdate transport repressor ModE-like protein